MKNRFAPSFVLFGVLCFYMTLSVEARNLENATVISVRPDNFDLGGFFLIVDGGTDFGTRNCIYPADANGGHYFIRKDNPLMNQLLSTALAAKAMDAKVIVAGNAICTQDFEDVRYIQLN